MLCNDAGSPFTWQFGIKRGTIMSVISRVLHTGGPLLGAMLLAAVLLPSAGVVRADELDVLKGRTVRVIIGGAPGETTDTDSRTFLTYLQAVLPQTTLRLQND